MSTLSVIRRRMAAIVAAVLLGACASQPPDTIGGGLDVAGTLADGRVETLYYGELPPGLTALVERPGVVRQLGQAYEREADPINRFNLVVVLNHRAQRFEDEHATILGILQRALGDPFAWVRTEAVWGYGYLSGPDGMYSVAPLLDDADPGVVNEAILALARMSGESMLPGANQRMSDDARARAVRYWKDRLASEAASGSAAASRGWTPEVLRMAIAGCRAAQFSQGFRALKEHMRREGLSEDDLPSSLRDDLAKSWEPHIHAVCDCGITELAKEFSPEDLFPDSPKHSEVNARLQALVAMGVCAPKPVH